MMSDPNVPPPDYMSELPPELILQILWLLDYKSQIRFSQVCKYVRNSVLNGIRDLSLEGLMIRQLYFINREMQAYQNFSDITKDVVNILMQNVALEKVDLQFIINVYRNCKNHPFNALRDETFATIDNIYKRLRPGAFTMIIPVQNYNNQCLSSACVIEFIVLFTGLLIVTLKTTPDYYSIKIPAPGGIIRRVSIGPGPSTYEYIDGNINNQYYGRIATFVTDFARFVLLSDTRYVCSYDTNIYELEIAFIKTKHV